MEILKCNADYNKIYYVDINGGLRQCKLIDGCKAVKHIVNINNACWHWDVYGFHCNLNDLYGCYRTKEECIKNNEVSVVTF